MEGYTIKKYVREDVDCKILLKKAEENTSLFKKRGEIGFDPLYNGDRIITKIFDVIMFWRQIFIDVDNIYPYYIVFMGLGHVYDLKAAKFRENDPQQQSKTAVRCALNLQDCIFATTIPPTTAYLQYNWRLKSTPLFGVLTCIVSHKLSCYYEEFNILPETIQPIRFSPEYTFEAFLSRFKSKVNTIMQQQESERLLVEMYRLKDQPDELRQFITSCTRGVLCTLSILAVCDTCLEGSYLTLRCKRCFKARYCSRDCQEKDWYENGHKNLCEKKKEK